MDSQFNPNTEVIYRYVLSEMPTVQGVLPYDVRRIDQVTNIVNTHVDLMSPSNVTLSTNPDELVINQRGRRKTPVSFSSDIDTMKQSTQELSSMELDDINFNNSVMIKNVSRKRLQLNDPLDLASSDNSDSGPSHPKKIFTISELELPESNCLPSVLEGSTSDQFINIIVKAINVEKEVTTNFPIPDLDSLNVHINYLLQNILKGLSTSTLATKNNLAAFTEVFLHILEFKKYIVDQGMRLVKSNQWSVVMDYVFMAWKHVRCSPIWDNSLPDVRGSCFESLSLFCMTALIHMKDTLDQTECDNYKQQMECEDMLNDGNEDIKLCFLILNLIG